MPVGGHPGRSDAGLSRDWGCHAVVASRSASWGYERNSWPNPEPSFPL
jgi:hypothetical protein